MLTNNIEKLKQIMEVQAFASKAEKDTVFLKVNETQIQGLLDTVGMCLAWGEKNGGSFEERQRLEDLRAELKMSALRLKA